jgi:hypothetical protein
MEQKKREKILTFRMPNAAIYVTPISIVGVADSSFRVLAVLLQCLQLALALFSFPPYNPDSHFCQGNPKSYKRPLSRLTGALAKASPFGWGGAIKSRERDSLGCLRFASGRTYL